VKEDVASSNRGKVLFTTAGCAACHANTPNAPTKKPREDDDPPAPYDALGSFYGLGSSTGPQGTYDLGALGSKTQPPILVQYLLNPLKTNPHGRMPAMGLNSNEALDLARFLCRTMDAKIDRTKATDPPISPKELAKEIPEKQGAAFLNSLPDIQWRILGLQLFTSKGCANCHTVTTGGQSLPKKEFRHFQMPKPMQLDPKDNNPFDEACVRDVDKPNVVPNFGFLDKEKRDALNAYVKSIMNTGFPNKEGSVIQDSRAAMKRFLCLNCHTKDGEGGISADLSDQMKQLEKAENADSVQPPRLTGIGHKARTAWLDEVLLKGGRARPWMGLRMPQYGTENVGFLPTALAHAEGTLADTGVAAAKPNPALLADGRTLTGKDGHGCIACHDISGIVGGGTRGTDLALVPNRLRRDWFDRWMDNPQRLAPGTQMPQYFLGGKAQVPLLDADPVKHTAAMWDYFSLGTGLPLPTGLEPPKGVVIAVKDRPELLRTFLPDGAGTRGVAVGYPGGMNIAFDQTQARLAYAWAGNFLDASPVWTNRGGAPAKLLGPKVWTGPAGHPWAVTDSRSPPDIAKQATDPAYGATLPEGQAFHGDPKLVIEGYSLDGAGVPTFAYRHTDGKGTVLRVEETPGVAKSPVAAGVVRKFEVTVSAGRVAWLNVGDAGKDWRVVGGKPEAELPTTARLVLPQSGRAIVLDAVALSGSAWTVVPKPAGGSSVMLRLPEGKSTVTVTHWAVPKDDDELIRSIPVAGK
jgi:mono/diheme cytochrome c family protein